LSLEGVLWSPSGDEIWFTSSASGSAENPRAVTLSGKLRTITNVPGGMWIEDLRTGTVLMATHQERIGIRGLAPGAKEERDLGWFGWSIVRDMSPDGRKIIFEEEGNGGTELHRIFARYGWIASSTHWRRAGLGDFSRCQVGDYETPEGGPLNLVPTGAGEARQLTHDAVSYGAVRWLPDGKRLLAEALKPDTARATT